MSPTDRLHHAAATLDRIVATVPDDDAMTAAIVAGMDAIHGPVPPGRPAARHALAAADFLRAWAQHEPDRAIALVERADAQDVMAALHVLHAQGFDA